MNIAQVLVTALLSGLFSGVMLFFLNDRRDRTSRRLSKIEDAASAYFRLSETASAYIHSAFDLSTRKATDEEWNAHNQPIHDEAVSHLVRAEIIFSIYAPDLFHVLNYVREPWVAGLKTVTDVRMSAERPEIVSEKLLEQLSNYSMLIVKGRQRGLKEVATYCQQLANQPIRKANVQNSSTPVGQISSSE